MESGKCTKNDDVVIFVKYLKLFNFFFKNIYYTVALVARSVDVPSCAYKQKAM